MPSSTLPKAQKDDQIVPLYRAMWRHQHPQFYELNKLTFFEATIADFSSNSYQHDYWTTTVAWVTCFAYGGIHAIGWDFAFATRTEQLLWRVSCPLLVILGTPIYGLMRLMLSDEHEGFWERLFSPVYELAESWLELFVFVGWDRLVVDLLRLAFKFLFIFLPYYAFCRMVLLESTWLWRLLLV
jgi:hypothetical protein